tara:strand:+ start:77 stop:742 length:666 start_codon:yes stop_codon:yes gene_type:complete
MKKAIILLSGGQDSTTCLYWAIKKFDYVEAIGFDYGQSHIQELKQAQKISKKLNIKYKIFDIKGLLASSSLTEHSDHSKESYINKSLPASFTSGRNILFLTIAASYGASIGISDLITGVCQTDFSGYPDCRKTTMDSLQTTLSLGLGAGDYRIHTPLMYLDKADTWKMAKEFDCLDVIINDTLTDYNGDMKKNEWGYGNEDNPATELRVKGYYKAKKLNWI